MTTYSTVILKTHFFPSLERKYVSMMIAVCLSVHVRVYICLLSQLTNFHKIHSEHYTTEETKITLLISCSQ